ncbi:MAG: hypothetical protein NW220_06920 [Leptolyngbyaceae cyanobacterium bins.349]|nr:hypothetical protein [Leptolyngbyaceae cyanobacterium bins.349]
MRILGASQFDQCVLSISLVNLCNQASHVGQQLRRLYQTNDTDEPTLNPWMIPHWFSLYVPHPDQEFEEITLEQGLTRGYNLEVKRIDQPEQVPYFLPRHAHFVTILKQKGLNQNYELAATGIFIRPLAIIKLDIIDNLDDATYQPVVVKHPIIRDYPSGWESKVQQYLKQEISPDALPDIVGYVDQAVNQDYRPPSWQEMHLMAKGFAGV